MSHRGTAFQGNGNAVGIVVPKARVDYVTARLRCAEGDAGNVQLVFHDERAEHRVVDVGRQLRMAPLADALHGDLQRRGLRTGRQILVLEYVVDTGIEQLVELLLTWLRLTRQLFGSQACSTLYDRMRQSVSDFRHLDFYHLMQLAGAFDVTIAAKTAVLTKHDFQRLGEVLGDVVTLHPIRARVYIR